MGRGPLDRLPPILQHLVLLLIPPLLGWGASDVVPWLRGQGGVAALAAAVLAQILLVITPATRSYGRGRHVAVTR